MDIKQVLAMLTGVRGPNGSGEYTCRCPAHEDATASLTVTQKRRAKDGKEVILFNCHAHCTQDAIIRALGLTWRDLIVDPDPEGPGAKRGGKPSRGNSQGRGKQKAAAAGTETSPPAPPLSGEGSGIPEGMTQRIDLETGEVTLTPTPKEPQKEEPRIDWGHPDAVYSYTDAEGRELFQVCRYQYEQDGKRQKTFRQRRYLPGDPKANRQGYVMSVPAEIRDTTLYRMPRIRQAIAEGKPVCVVEGEKDVETLERLGFTATCNPGGAGKWRDGYNRVLAGADVIIFPDNDPRNSEGSYTGQDHAYNVALNLRGIAKRVRLVDIKEACPELPPKGDVSDMVQLMGETEAMDALARQVAATGDFDPEAVPFWLTPEEQLSRLYRAVPGYGVKDGCIIQWQGADPKALCDFAALPRMELTRDDGAETSLHFVLDGWNARGRKLPRITIKAGDLDGMSWVTEKWGFDASLSPGSTTKSKVSWAIKKVGQLTAKRVTEYAHTGWRKIGGKWAYLYHGGAIGMDGITVDMGDRLKIYRLDGGGSPEFAKIPYAEAARTSLRLLEAMKEEIAVSLLGTVFLAPLREFLIMSDIAPSFCLFLYGESGTHKTTAASLALAHFGNFNARNAPASFSDTANQIRRKAFLLKDMPILVDDFHPVTSVQERRQMSAAAQALSRAFGDGADRGRLNADSTIKNSNPPRSVAIITGEDLPAIGASGLARFFILDIDKGDIPVGKTLTELQELARRGYLQRSMRGYILWLLKQTDSMPARLHDLFLQYREEIRSLAGEQHDRAPETVTCILIGYAMMLNYCRDLGLFDTKQAARMLVAARGKLLDASRKQTRETESEKPTRIFLDSLGELLSSKRAALKDLTLVDAKDPPATEQMIGYMDADYYYLLPSTAFGMVQRLCREQGAEFPVSLKALYKHLRTDGVITANTTETKRICDKVVRVMRIPAGMINGPTAQESQTKMDFQPVSNDDLPAEWK